MNWHTQALAFSSTLAMTILITASISLVTVSTGCSEEELCDLTPESATVDASVCDLTAGPFSLTIDNPYFPLVPGVTHTLEGTEDGDTIRVEFVVTSLTEPVGGVTTRVVTETEYINEVIVEVANDFYAQAPDGTVCYFGEDVDNYVGGVFDNNNGQWRAGLDGNEPGIFMPATPAVGDIFIQERAAPIAQDMAQITTLGESLSTSVADYSDTVTALDCNTIERDEFEKKVYVSGIGLAYDDGISLITFTP